MTLADVRNILRDELGVDLEIDLDSRLEEDLELDSLARMELITILEERGAHFTDPNTVRRVGELLENIWPGPSLTGSDLPLFSAASPAIDSLAAGPAGPTQLGFGPGVGESLPVVLSSDKYVFTTVMPSDIPFLYGLAVDESTAHRWRFRGRAPSMDTFVSMLNATVLLQLVVRDRSNLRPLGHCVCYQAELSAGYAHLAAVFHTPTVPAGAGARATAVFARYLFQTWPLRKLYMEVPEFNYHELLASGSGKFFDVEGRLLKHDYGMGRYWDKYILAIYPEMVPS